MTIHKKIALTLGTLVLLVSAGIAFSQFKDNQPRTTYGNSYGNQPAVTVIVATSTPKTGGSKVPPTTITKAPNTYTLADVATHNTATSCWSAINGGVYDLTSWINQHPGGAQAILGLCGRDGSAAFNDQHGGQRRPANELAGFQIGTLI